MRLFLLGAMVSLGALYSLAAYSGYRDEREAREAGTPVRSGGSRHPEANLRALREAFESDDYSDALFPYIEGTLDEAPAFYQTPFLLATFLANRLDEPARIRQSFEAALTRYPSNGRLHLTFAEWLLTPRAPAPYRLYREPADSDSRAVALDHLERATGLEPDLTRTALGLLLRFRVPSEQWASRLPRTETTKLLILEAVERSPRNRALREELLREFVADAEGFELLRGITTYARRWEVPDLAVAAALRWRSAALALGEGREVTRATTALAGMYLDDGESERAYALVRETLAAFDERSVPTESSVELLSSVGTTYLGHGQRAMAQGLLSEAVTLSPYHVPSRLGLARVFLSEGELESAQMELDDILRLDPSNAQATAMQSEILRLSRSGSER